MPQATILAVDDEPSDLENLQTILSGCGHNVITASAGDEALRAYADLQKKLDLLVIDIAMSPMNGCELARALIETHNDLRVVFVSGYVGEQALMSDETRISGSLFLRKPFTAADLLAVVRRALGEEDVREAAQGSGPAE